MAAVLELNVIVTSYDVIGLYCGPQRKHFSGCTICPLSFVVIASIISELRGGGRITPPSPASSVPEDQKKRGLNRVKIFLLA